ncbi:related to 2-3-cyclic-nucleotide 3-phosphodiesterase [Fusarium torulosum]|uniref:Related to 2-3-cyclic-nucleotide 3-phosphodiesterase n=1 Tax=Fusarium torulosum TaxID=33205 RepID=A0AAE8SIT2_9HYPO|nr:related to 2-3-cyclic-nucleotide 3-phosphodiesterase [Fusarium torulosum]
MGADTAVQDGDKYCNHTHDKSAVPPRNGHFTPNSQPQIVSKPTVIGIYGISGSGKSFILHILRQDLDPAQFIFFEGSEVIDSLVPGGLKAFRASNAEEQSRFRIEAINFIKNETSISGKTAVVTGHLMFWSEIDNAPKAVYTSEDLDTFTHIIYLHTPVEIISRRIVSDIEKPRPVSSTESLRKWQDAELLTLRDLCRQHGILFLAVSEARDLIPKLKDLVHYFRRPATAEDNIAMVRSGIDQFLALPCNEGLDTVLVLDGDKTLAAEDTGALFWQEFARTRPAVSGECPLKNLFSGPMGYSDAAFRQATLLYEEAADATNFDAICQTVASSVTLHPEIVSLLELVAAQKHVGAIVVTCGIALVWTKVLERYGLSDAVKVIGGGRISNGFVVTASVKASVVSHLQDIAHLYVWAFGDSPLDIPMLKKADQAIVVVGEERTRSSTMELALSEAIDKGELQARQVLLPGHSPPRLDTRRLPLISLDDQELIHCIFSCRPFQLLQATEKAAAKILMAPMRDAAVAGPSLREAHANVGRYLATEYVSQLIGLEEYDIAHVQGHSTTGHRLCNEHRTSIVALMRGGEAMAFGINEVFPKAMFIHASCADDIKLHHIQCQSTVILVDSVANSGKTLIQFIRRVGRLEAKVRIVVVVGVVQADAVAETHVLAKVMRRHGISMVALRVSENKFTGTKATDTGNRMFNTTHLA